MSKSISDLYDSLFETLEAVKDGSMDLERAKMVTEVGQTIINTAKVEVLYIRETGGAVTSSFIEQKALPPEGTNEGPAPVVTRIHRIKG